MFKSEKIQKNINVHAITNRRLRIAHIQPFTMDLYGHKDDDWGRSVKYFLTHIATAQARLGDHVTVHLLTSGSPKRHEIEGVNVCFHSCLQLPKYLPLTARYGRQISLGILKAIIRDEVDLIHFSGAGSLHFMLGAIAWRAKQLGLPLFSQDQGPRRGKWLEEKCKRYGIRHSTVLMVPSLDAQKEYEKMGYPAEKIYLIPNGFDAKMFFPGPGLPFHETEGLHEGKKPFRILVVSRLWEDKDPLTMAEAVCQLVQGGIAVDLTIVGQGVLRSKVEDRLRQGGVAVKFIEHIAQEKLAEYYRLSDVMLLTSLGEGWNCASVEALASGLPVVASKVRGVQEPLGDAGILVPPKRPDLFADTLRLLAKDKKAAYDYRKRGIERAKAFTWEAVVTKMREIYLLHL